MDGIQALLEGLGVQPDDLVFGYLYYIMDAKNSTEFSKQEFARLLGHTNSSSMQELKASLPNLRK